MTHFEKVRLQQQGYNDIYAEMRSSNLAQENRKISDPKLLHYSQQLPW